jgi:hypothetical protein
VTASRQNRRVTDLPDDVALLQRYEPVIRFTDGELFLPAAIEPYVASASLWRLEPGTSPRCVVPSGELGLNRLVAEAAADPEADLSLRFVEAPLGRREFRAWRRRPDRPVFRTGGRFARVGLLSRLIDAAFRLGLLLRGRVPGGLAAAAEQRYRTSLDPDRHPYYGRVVHDGGYVVLQYWFFYAMNDWRSGFGGANDHEGDWEQVTVYLGQQPDGVLVPAWVACSAHDEVGDDLRRRWDDPELTWVGDHPVVFAGAGSHSGAFVCGEYVTAVNPPGRLQGAFRVLQTVAHVLTPWSRGQIATGVGVPFVDYARGDGASIGPGSTRSWSPVVIDDETPWVGRYRGLWGLDTRDRFGGERAPAGPRYERTGIVRQSWSDPLAWAGLQKVAASAAETAELLRHRLVELDMEIVELDATIAQRRRTLRQLVAETASIRDRQAFASIARERQVVVESGERELHALMAERTASAAEREAHMDTLARPPTQVAPQAHLRHKVMPVGQADRERTRFLRVWSTISTPLLFAAAAWLLVDHSLGVIAGVTIFTVAFLIIEAIARGRLFGFILTLLVIVIGVTVALAAIEGVLERWRVVIAVLLVAIAAAILAANLRDLRRG